MIVISDESPNLALLGNSTPIYTFSFSPRENDILEGRDTFQPLVASVVTTKVSDLFPAFPIHIGYLRLSLYIWAMPFTNGAYTYGKYSLGEN